MLTVLLATRNRAQILRDVLDAYCKLEKPPAGWKLLVVDNGSSDHTPEVVALFRDRLPLHLVSEPMLGKNHALNTGLGLIEGDLVVFTDDDTFPHADWLIQMQEAANSHLEYSIFGGAVAARWEVSPPGWIEWVDRGPVFTLTDPSQKEGPIAPYLVFGPNMAIRASIFQSGMRFDPSIGPRGSDYPMGSETELLLRLSSQGQYAWYVAGAVVEHLIREEQLRKAWVFERAVRYGRGFYRLSHADETFKGKLWMSVPRHFFRDIPKEGAFAILARACWKKDASFRSRWKFNFLRGQAIEARAIARSKKMQAESPSSGA